MLQMAVTYEEKPTLRAVLWGLEVVSFKGETTNTSLEINE